MPEEDLLERVARLRVIAASMVEFLDRLAEAVAGDKVKVPAYDREEMKEVVYFIAHVRSAALGRLGPVRAKPADKEPDRAVGYRTRNGMISLVHAAHAAANDGTPEGTALAARWKRLQMEYVGLSTRYLALQKQIQKLYLDPDEICARYEALDDAFDENWERTQPLFSDLEEWAKTART